MIAPRTIHLSPKYITRFTQAYSISYKLVLYHSYMNSIAYLIKVIFYTALSNINLELASPKILSMLTQYRDYMIYA